MKLNKSVEEIKDELARSKGFDDFNDYEQSIFCEKDAVDYSIEIIEFMEEVCEAYAHQWMKNFNHN